MCKISVKHNNIKYKTCMCIYIYLYNMYKKYILINSAQYTIYHDTRYDNTLDNV